MQDAIQVCEELLKIGQIYIKKCDPDDLNIYLNESEEDFDT